jgi:ABC-type glycerol-3-phosphate transport system substrate-binding protein
MKKKILISSLLIAILISFSGCDLSSALTGSEVKQSKRKPKITLTVLAGQSTSDAGIEDMINEMLKKKCPDIELEWECVDWGEKFASQMTARFSAGDVPDIMIGKAQDVATYVSSGNLAPLSGTYQWNIVDASLPAVTVDGKIYGLPYNAMYQGVLYNKDIFKKYGIDVPTTQAELKETIKKLKEVNVTPYASHFQETWSIGNMTMQFAMNDVFNKFPDFGDRLRRGVVSFKDSKEFQNCFKYNRDILNSTWDDALLVNQAECDTRFAGGKAAMYVTGSWSLQIINQMKPDMNVGIFPFPNEKGNAKLIFEPNITFMKSARTQYSDAVDKVLEAIFSDKELAAEVFDFTKTASMLKGVSSVFPNSVQSDIDRYVKSQMVTDATVGNTQLIWTFQEDYSKQILSWLQGNENFEDILRYADQNINSSIAQSK